MPNGRYNQPKISVTTMSVAAVTTPDWRQWEGEMAAGEFPLEQFLGAGEKSAVFRTRLASGDGAIKLVPAGNVQAALKRHGITYPVAQDNESATWNAWRGILS